MQLLQQKHLTINDMIQRRMLADLLPPMILPDVNNCSIADDDSIIIDEYPD
jgi:hypothetical protein